MPKVLMNGETKTDDGDNSTPVSYGSTESPIATPDQVQPDVVPQDDPYRLQ